MTGKILRQYQIKEKSELTSRMAHRIWLLLLSAIFLPVAAVNSRSLFFIVDQVEPAAQSSTQVAADLVKLADEQWKAGKTEQAIQTYKQAIRLDPQYEKAYLGLSNLLSESGKDDEQIALLYSAHALIPTSADIARSLMNLLFWEQRYEDEIKVGREYSALNPDNAMVQADIGEAYFKLRQYSDAIAAMERATALDSKLDTVLHNLGLAYRLVGRYQEAVITMRKILDREPQSDIRNQAWLEMFANLELLGQISEATAEIDKEMRLNPDSPYALAARADIRQSQNQFEDAIADLKQALALVTTSDLKTRIFFSMSNTYMQMSRFPDVIEMANKALEIAPETDGYEEIRFRCQHFLATAYAITSRCDKAWNAFEKAISLRPDDMGIYNNLSICLKEAGHMQDAEKAVRYSVKLAPDQLPPRYNLSLILLEQGRFAEAETELNECLRLGGKDWKVYLNFGRMRLQQRRLKEAASMLTQAHQLQPADPMIDNDLSYTLSELGERSAEALELAQRAVRANPDSAAFRDTLGWAYFKSGKYPEAEKEFLLARRSSPGQPEILEHLGYVYEKEGKTADAISQWKQALSLTRDEEMKSRLKAKLGAN
jgi:tetratricopeptide (TPR) repeat protein